MTDTQELKDGWVVYGGMWCGFCRKARAVLDSSDKVDRYVWNEVPKDDTREKVKDRLKEYTDNCRTFPMIFYNKKFIGGSDKLNEYIDSLNNTSKTNVGGLGKSNLVDDELRDVCKNMRSEIVQKLIEDDRLKEAEKEDFNYEPNSYKTQLVNGVNYFVDCIVDKEKDIHLRIHKSFKGKFSFVSYRYPVDPKDDIRYF